MTYHTDGLKAVPCKARKTNGQPCGAWAIRGSTVCVVHGGRAPQVQRRARQRLDDMVDPALARLRKLIDHKSGPVALNAVRDVLDRTGYKLPERLETDSAVTIKVEYEIIEQQPMAEVPRETIVDVQALQLPEGSYTNGHTTTNHSS